MMSDQLSDDIGGLNLVQRNWEDYSPDMLRRFLEQQSPEKQMAISPRGPEGCSQCSTFVYSL